MLKHFAARPSSCLRTSFLLNPAVHTYLNRLHIPNPLPQRSYYATKSKLKSTASFIPSSKKSPITTESAREEYDKCETAMKASVDYFRKDCAAAENRALGRVTPALLSPVRVKLPDAPNGVRLEELATVGVREGSILVITLFSEHVNRFSFFFLFHGFFAL
jgi:ribosome recycling factor